MSRLPMLLLLSVLLITPAVAGEGGGAPPDFTLTSTTGESFTLSNHVGKEVVVLSFWATWCAPCADEMKQLQAMHGKYAKDGLTVIGVNVESAGTLDKVKTTIAERGVTYPILLDHDTAVFKQFNAKRNLPFFMIVGKDGQIASKHAGFKAGDEVALEAEIKALLAK